MIYPQFTIWRFGFYNADVVMPRKQENSRRIVSYEFEFYTADFPGGLTVNGEVYPARRGRLQVMVRPYKCYFINIITQDPELCELFHQLSTSFMLWNMAEVVALFQQMLSRMKD